MDILTPLCGSVAQAASLGLSLTIILDCVMTFFGSTANDAAYNAWLTDVGDETNRGKIEGINAMMPLVSILVVFGGFMGFNLDFPESWTYVYCMIGGVVLVVGVLGFFLIEDVPGKDAVGEASDEPEIKKLSGEKSAQKNANAQKTGYLYNLVYSFRPRVVKENKVLYGVILVFAIFGISIQTYMPYLILYYEKTLQMSNYVLVMAPAIILASVVTAFYGRVYDKWGFQNSVLPSMGLLIAGYVILYFTTTTIPVFMGSLLMMCGYLTGMAVFGAVIREQIPENMSGRFQGLRIIGQVLIPGVIGPAIGAWVLRDAARIENSDGTFSFLPDKGIWTAALIVAMVVLVALVGVFALMRQNRKEHR